MAIQMNFNQLYFFYMTVQCGGIRAAAKKLHVSPPAVTIQIKKLEQWLGFSLFDRQGSSLTLTREGEEIYPMTLDIFAPAAKLDMVLKNMMHRQNDVLYVGSHITPAQNILPALLNYIRIQAPHIDMRMVLGSHAEILQRVIEGEVHVALTTSTGHDSEKKLIFTKFMQQEVHFIVCAHNAVGAKEPLDAAALSQIPMLMPQENSGFAVVLGNYFKTHNIQPKIKMSDITSDIAKKLIPNSESGAFFADYTVKSDLDKGIVRKAPLKIPLPTLTTYFAHQKEANISNITQVFLQLLPNQEVFYDFLYNENNNNSTKRSLHF